MKKRYFLFVLFAIVVFGFALRSNDLLSQRDYWYDEAFTGILLKQSFSEMNQSIIADVHPPLYYWLAKPWSSMFDYSPEGIRYFSVFLGILIIISIYWVTNKLFNQRAAFLASTLAAFSPFAIEYSQEARMYALFGILMVWATWFFYRALLDNKLKNWLLWGVFAGLSFYTHYLALFFFVMFYLTYILIKRSQGKGGWMKSVLGERNLWIGIGVIFVFFGSWIKFFIGHMMKGNLGWIDPSYLSDIPKTLQIFFFGHPAGTGGVPWSNEFRYFFDGSSAGLIILSVILILLTIAFIKKIKRTEFIVLTVMSLGTLIFLIVLSHFNIKLYVARYFMPAALIIFILIAGLITEVFRSRWAWIITAACYSLLLLNLNPLNFNTNWGEIYSNQSNFLGEFDYVVTSNPFDYSTARYYFGEDKVKYYNKGNPGEDFSGWVVVGNENRIADIDEVNKIPNAVIIDNNCEWENVNITRKVELGNFSVCKIN